MDKISIIVPIYNGEKYLKRCIEALLKQTYKNIEIICVNDGSSDKTLDILNEYAVKDKRVVVLDKKNTGVSDSRNQAIKKANGDYICFCDADDMYEDNFIEVMHNLIDDNGVPLVRCNYKVIDDSGKEIGEGNVLEGKYNTLEIKNNLIPSCLDGSIPCFSYLLMIKKDVLNCWFPTDVAMMEDVVFYIDLLLKVDEIYVTDRCLYTIMFNDEGATNRVGNYERNINHVLLVNEKISELLKKNNLASEDNIWKLNVNNLNSIADFIFRYYLFGDNPIDFCKKINSLELINLIDSTNLTKINLVRRILLQLISNKHYLLLRIYFVFRKMVFKLKRR